MEHVKLNVQLALSPRVQIILRSTLTLVLIAALALLSVLQELSPRANTGCTGDKDNRQRDAAISASETGVSFCLQIYFYLPDTILLVSRNQYAMIQLSNINRTSCNSSDSFH